jgi:hypothetical protein
MTKDVKQAQNVPQVNLGMGEDVKPRVETAQVAPNSPVAAIPYGEPSKPRAQGIERGRGYVKRQNGYPVQPGQTWHDLTHQERVNYMTGKENQWKRNFGMASQSMQANLDWTRG